MTKSTARKPLDGSPYSDRSLLLMPRGPRMTPAAVALARAGVAQRQISGPLGYKAPQAVSAQFAGLNRPHPDLIPTIRVVAGPAAATEIAEILGVTA